MRRILAVAAAALLVAGASALPLRAQAPRPAIFDVAVAGGTPEGVAAAVSAAREGLSVVLIEPADQLGGTMVLSGLNTVDLNRGPDGKLLNGGIFSEWYRQVEGDSFDTGTAAAVFRRLVESEPRITLWMETEITGARSGTEGLHSLQVRREGRLETVQAGRYIDATEDAEVAAAAGVRFTLGREDYIGERSGQAVTLVFRLTGIDWVRAADYLREDGDPDTGASARSLWGYNEIMYRYAAESPRIAMRGLNVGRQNDGSGLVNALWIFGVNPLSESSRQEAMAIARAELPRVVEYIRRNCPGMEGAQLGGTASRLYVRETRHLAEALYLLSIDDVLENRDQPDAIAHGSYPVDIQAGRPGEQVMIVGAPIQYAVPLRSLIPGSKGNLLVASRSAGYSSLAHGSARTIPVGMAAAQAAGVAAAVSLEQGVGLPDLAGKPELVRTVQARLRARGVKLAPFRHRSPLEGHPYAEDVRFFRRRGLVHAGYHNRYDLDQAVSAAEARAFLGRSALLFGRDLAIPAGAHPREGMTRGMLYRTVRRLLEAQP